MNQSVQMPNVCHHVPTCAPGLFAECYPHANHPRSGDATRATRYTLSLHLRFPFLSSPIDQVSYFPSLPVLVPAFRVLGLLAHAIAVCSFPFPVFIYSASQKREHIDPLPCSTMVNMRGTTERSPLLPIQRGQRDYEVYSEKRPLEFESYTTPHGVHKHDHGSDNPFAPIYAPIVRRISLETTRRYLNQLLLPSAVLTLLLTGYLIALCRNSHGEDPRILYARPADSDNYDSGASFAPFATQKLWAAYSPYYSVEEYQPPPNDCRLSQVNIVRSPPPTVYKNYTKLRSSCNDMVHAILHLDSRYTLRKLSSDCRPRSPTPMKTSSSSLIINITWV